MNPNLYWRRIFYSVTISLFITAQAQAVDRFWTNPGSGNFTDALSWDTTFPVTSDNGFINNSGTAIIDSSQNAIAAVVVLGSTNTASSNLMMSGGTLTTSSDVRIGGNNVTVTGGTSGGAGIFTQSAGDVLSVGVRFKHHQS